MRHTVTLVVSPLSEARTLRRTYIALGALAIGVGAGIGILVSEHTGQDESAPQIDASKDRAKASKPPARNSTSGPPGPKAGPATIPDARTDVADAGGGSAGAPSTPGIETLQSLIAAERDALVKGDAHALAGLVSPTAFGFGIDADEAGEGRDAIESQLRHDLGDVPAGGFTVDSKLLKIGELPGHAWIAQELELGGSGQPIRRFAITQLVAIIAGHWQVVAWEWGVPVADPIVERLAILGTLPIAKLIPDRHDGNGDLVIAVHTAFGSRAAFADARSERDDAFNFGSALGEHVVGGATIKRIFTKLHAQLRLRDGARVADASLWDPSQKSPTIGWSAVNVDFTAKTRAATDVTQTFRVLAIWVREGSDWRIVQTQFSNGGPIR